MAECVTQWMCLGEKQNTKTANCKESAACPNPLDEEEKGNKKGKCGWA